MIVVVPVVVSVPGPVRVPALSLLELANESVLVSVRSVPLAMARSPLKTDREALALPEVPLIVSVPPSTSTFVAPTRKPTVLVVFPLAIASVPDPLSVPLSVPPLSKANVPDDTATMPVLITVMLR